MTSAAARIRPATVLLAAAVLLLAVFVYDGVLRPLLSSVVELPVAVGGLSRLTTVLFLFSVCHATYCLGPRHSLAFIAIAAVVSWTFEQVGVETGLVYGRYAYSDVLGAKVGHVPVLIPVAWFMMIWPSRVIAGLIAEGRPIGPPRSRAGLVAVAALAAAVMTAWDLVVDPILSGPSVEAWTWQDGGPYFGVPVQNFVGWLATTLTVYLAYGAVERRWLPRPMDSVPATVVSLALAAYGAMLLANLLSGAAPPALAVIGPFVMGVPLFAAAIRLATIVRAEAVVGQAHAPRLEARTDGADSRVLEPHRGR